MARQTTSTKVTLRYIHNNQNLTHIISGLSQEQFVTEVQNGNVKRTMQDGQTVGIGTPNGAEWQQTQKYTFTPTEIDNT